MNGLRYLALIALLLLGAPAASLAADSAKVVFEVNFTDYKGGPVLKWLAAKGFTAKRDADSEKSVGLAITDNELVLQTKRKAAGLLLNEKDVLGFSRVRIEWGVDMFPAGASYLHGVRSEAVMVLFFFGKEKLSSGSLLIPDSPYFLGLFLCDTDPVDQAFNGRYFKAGGRYICVDHAAVGQSVVTDYPLAEAFRRTFSKTEVPEISGIGISIDTESAKGNGVAKGFVKTIQFLE